MTTTFLQQLVLTCITAGVSLLTGGGVIKYYLERKELERAVQREERDKEKSREMEETMSKCVAPLEAKICEMSTEINNLKKDFDLHTAKDDQYRAENARTRVIRFAGELASGETPPKELFDSILEDIDNYEDYCDTHPQYENSKAVASIAFLRDEYMEYMKGDKHFKVI